MNKRNQQNLLLEFIDSTIQAEIFEKDRSSLFQKFLRDKFHKIKNTFQQDAPQSERPFRNYDKKSSFFDFRKKDEDDEFILLIKKLKELDASDLERKQVSRSVLDAYSKSGAAAANKVLDSWQNERQSKKQENPA